MSQDLLIDVPGRGEVAAILDRPASASCLLVLAHGAGAGMRHIFMDEITRRLGERGVAVLRYQFPYMEAGRRGPDRPPVLAAAVRAAIDAGHAAAPDLPLFAGGKSMGGRMSSTAMSSPDLSSPGISSPGMSSPDNAPPDVRGLIFFGFPLHPAGRPGTVRGDHLAQVEPPMLFLQGTRDKLAELELLRPICDQLDSATLHVVDGADHGFHVLKRSGRTDAEVLDELADTAVAWTRQLAA